MKKDAKQTITVIPEGWLLVPKASLDELRMNFDYLANHGMTRAKTFESWLRLRGYSCGDDSKWYFDSKSMTTNNR